MTADSHSRFASVLGGASGPRKSGRSINLPEVSWLGSRHDNNGGESARRQSSKSEGADRLLAGGGGAGKK